MKRYCLVLTMSICTLSMPAFSATSEKAKTTSSVFQVRRMPDYCQLDRRLPDEGLQYCGPTAISNALVWLGKNGYPALLPDEDDLYQAQFKVIKTLGSETYMKTAINAGTDPLDVMSGLDKYIRDCGYEPIIEWKGYREGGKYAAGQIPYPEWLEKGMAGDSNIVLEIGWYNYCARCDSFDRTGGHYVTLVGISMKNKFPRIIIHNPSLGGGQTPKPQICRLVPIKHGTLSAWGNYPDRSAKGFCKLEGITLPDDSRYAIVEGAIKFTAARKLTAKARPDRSSLKLAENN